jgi:hypothetical protein
MNLVTGHGKGSKSMQILPKMMEFWKKNTSNKEKMHPFGSF